VIVEARGVVTCCSAGHTQCIPGGRIVLLLPDAACGQQWPLAGRYTWRAGGGSMSVLVHQHLGRQKSPGDVRLLGKVVALRPVQPPERSYVEHPAEDI